MAEEIRERILTEIEKNNRIVLCRHVRPDGDAIGSTLGLCRILRQSYPEKDIRVINEDTSESLSFLGTEDSQENDDFYRDALVLLLDTSSLDRCSNKKAGLAGSLIKIDHHPEDKLFDGLSWVEANRSSTCEMIASFYLHFQDRLKIDKAAATAIYAGMVTDSGRFQYNSTSPETLRCAAEMLAVGIDTTTMYAHLELRTPDEFRFESYVHEKMQFTENGVAYIYVDKAVKQMFSLTEEQASGAVDYLSKIKGSILWLAFIDNADGTVRVRLRSRFAEIQPLAVRYHGGGHACASGATLSGPEEINRMLRDADRFIKEYKESNTAWL